MKTTTKVDPKKTQQPATKVNAPQNKSAPSKELTTPKQTAVATYDADYDVADTGLQNVTARDLIIPRLTILQALSPQLNAKKAEFIPDAKMGMFCDTGVGELWDGELIFLPCYYARIYIEWAPRSSGKGMVRNYGTDDSILAQCERDERNRNILPNGNYIAETATYYGFVQSASGQWRRSFLPLTSTNLKAARKWMTLITSERLQRPDGTEFQPPIWYRTWKACLTEESNNDGDWFGWRFEPYATIKETDPSCVLMKQAKEFQKQAEEGIVTGDMRDTEDEEQTVNQGNGDRM